MFWSLPDQWCCGNIVPIFKSSDKKLPKNYRGITISSCLSKLFSVILNDRLVRYLEVNQILCKEQIGFCKGNRTADHVLTLKSIIDYYKSKKKRIFTCFVDFSSAFDRIWHDGLIYKLLKLGIPKYLIHILKDIYSKISANVNIKNQVTEVFSCKIGTRQGCSLSPSLFNMYLNDLPEIFIKKANDSVNINGRTIGSLLYADDLVIISQSESGLQKSLNALNTYCYNWRLKINYQKTKIMIFNNKKQGFNFRISNHRVNITDKICYLGFIFTPSGSFKSCFKYLYNKALRAMFSVRSSLRSILVLPIHTSYGTTYITLWF